MNAISKKQSKGRLAIALLIAFLSLSGGVAYLVNQDMNTIKTYEIETTTSLQIHKNKVVRISARSLTEETRISWVFLQETKAINLKLINPYLVEIKMTGNFKGSVDLKVSNYDQSKFYILNLWNEIQVTSIKLDKSFYEF